jgi:hypothetical protein
MTTATAATAATIEERLARLEETVARLTNEPGAKAQTPWWKKIVGVYKNDPEFDEAMRLGREYRESLRPEDEEDGEAAA